MINEIELQKLHQNIRGGAHIHSATQNVILKFFVNGWVFSQPA